MAKKALIAGKSGAKLVVHTSLQQTPVLSTFQRFRGSGMPLKIALRLENIAKLVKAYMNILITILKPKKSS